MDSRIERLVGQILMQSYKLTILFALFCLADLTFAEDSPYYITGAGASSCGTYTIAYEEYRPYSSGVDNSALALRAAGSYLQYEAWIQGFLVASNFASNGKVKKIDEAGLQIWVYNYCKSNPLKSVADAATQLYFELGGPVIKDVHRASK